MFFRIILLTAGLFLLQHIPVVACGVCGCGMGGQSMGILPQWQFHFLGVRYSYRHFTTHHPASLLEPGQDNRSVENLQTLSLWGRWQPNARLQVLASVPLQYNSQTRAGDLSQAAGLGDVELQAFFAPVVFSPTARWKHHLGLGATLRLPTGRSDISVNGEKLHPVLQPGTGAFDFGLNALYALRRGNTGLMATASYRIATRNADLFRFGNRTTLAAQTFYWISFGKWSLVPRAGLSAELAEGDHLESLPVENTGGQLLQAIGGADLYFKRYALGFDAQLPLYENLSGGHVDAHPQLSARILFNF